MIRRVDGDEPVDDEGTEPRLPVATAAPLAPAPARRGGGTGPPPVLDAEFKVVPPAWAPWRRLRDSWWAIGPYLAYCTALWGLAALVGWLMDRGRGG